jgi:hypothetical protein
MDIPPFGAADLFKGSLTQRWMLSDSRGAGQLLTQWRT